MFEKIKGIRIKSSVFETETDLDLFEGEFEDQAGVQNDRVSLLFGRNGSGKTTLARGINQIKSGIGDATLVSFINKDNDEVILTDGNKKSMFIFHEDYIVNKVQISQDGLDTIVIFGKQNDIDSEIEKIEMQLNSSINNCKSLELKLKKQTDEKNEQSPDFWKNRIYESLKGTGNWAERDREIKRNRTASSINPQIIKKISELKPTLSKSDLDCLFSEKKERYLSLLANSTTINNKLACVEIEFNYDRVLNLLSRKIEKPELTSRDEYLLNLISDSSKGERYLNEVKDFFRKTISKNARIVRKIFPIKLRMTLLVEYQNYYPNPLKNISKNSEGKKYL